MVAMRAALVRPARPPTPTVPRPRSLSRECVLAFTWARRHLRGSAWRGRGSASSSTSN